MWCCSCPGAVGTSTVSADPHKHPGEKLLTLSLLMLRKLGFGKNLSPDGCWCKTQLYTSCVHLLRSSCYPWKYKKLGIKIGPQSFRWLFVQEPFELSAVASLSHLWNLVLYNFEWASRGMPDAFIWIRVDFFCISDKWKEGCVSDACRNVNAVMLPVVGGILLLWWSVFLNHYFKMPFLWVLYIIGQGSW